MALSKEDLEKIDEYVKSRLTEWLSDLSLAKPPHVYEIELRERMVRVEEELKNLGNMMHKNYEIAEKRFEHMEKRFEQVDKRFEQVDRKFDQIDKRFEQVDKRFELVDKRFDQVDNRLDKIDNRMFRFMIWSFGFTLTCTGTIIAVLKLG